MAFLAAVLWLVSGVLAEGSAEGERSDELKRAAFDGDFRVVKNLVTAGVNMESGRAEGHSALANAVLKGHDEIAVWLLSRGASVDTLGGTREGTTLMNAAASHCVQTLRLVLERGVRTNTKDDRGWTALMYVAHQNDEEAVKLLAEHRGTRLNLRNNGGRTALHIAAWSNAVQVVRYLLGRGADRAVRDDSGETAFQIALYESTCAWEGPSSVARAKEIAVLLRHRR